MSHSGLIKGQGSDVRLQKDYRKIIVFIHGFRGLPEIWDEISDKIYSEGFSVWNIRLPGHGCADHNEILKYRLRDWELYIENILLDLFDRYEEVSVCALSVGAALALLMQDRFKNFKKCVLISPFLQFKGLFAYFLFIFKYLIKKVPVPPEGETSDPVINRKLIPFYPVPQLYEIKKLTDRVRKKLKSISGNFLCFLSAHDGILDVEKHRNLIGENPNIRLEFLENSGHLPLFGDEKDKVIGGILKFLSAKS